MPASNTVRHHLHAKPHFIFPLPISLSVIPIIHYIFSSLISFTPNFLVPFHLFTSLPMHYFIYSSSFIYSLYIILLFFRLHPLIFISFNILFFILFLILFLILFIPPYSYSSSLLPIIFLYSFSIFFMSLQFSYHISLPSSTLFLFYFSLSLPVYFLSAILFFLFLLFFLLFLLYIIYFISSSCLFPYLPFILPYIFSNILFLFLFLLFFLIPLFIIRYIFLNVSSSSSSSSSSLFTLSLSFTS